jgi:hypothetical protein
MSLADARRHALALLLLLDDLLERWQAGAEYTFGDTGPEPTPPQEDTP